MQRKPLPVQEGEALQRRLHLLRDPPVPHLRLRSNPHRVRSNSDLKSGFPMQNLHDNRS